MSFRITGIDHIHLTAPEGHQDLIRAFFGVMLKLTEIKKPEIYERCKGIWYQLGAQQLRIGVEQDFIPATSEHPALVVENLALLKIRLKSYDVPVDPQPALDGAERFFISDPFGNRIELVERI